LQLLKKQLSLEEKNQINHQVRAELIDHLYRGCLPGVISGVPASTAIFINFYGYSPLRLLIEWYIVFNSTLAGLAGLYFFHIKYKNRVSIQTWEWTYSLMMCACASLWVPCIYLMPNDLTRQFMFLIALFLITTGYGTGTIGQLKLCAATLNIILMPLILWCFIIKGGIVYNIIGTYSLIYLFFMIGANIRSTQWFKDSLKLKLENTLVSYQATHDLLTQLPNQRLLPQYIQAAINKVKNTQDTFALVCFSLNRMEMINDSLGHQAGDLIMQAVTHRLTALAAQQSKAANASEYVITISRKDTFNIIILPLQRETAEEKIKLLFSVLNEPFFLEKQGIKLTASIGVSFYGSDGNDDQSLLVNADAAMLQGKRSGGNRLEFYRTEINEQLPKQLELETDLHAALQNKQLLLYYQPLVCLRTNQIIGMEALLRWSHPTHGFISPANFIPLAEETGLIVPIGEWVLQEACRQTQLWHQMGFSSLKIAVNLAEKQLRQKDLIGTIQRILKETGFDSDYLELEITETAILDEAIIHVIKEFKNMGLSLSVDDFGTGYSGLSYLKRFSINKIKIDQSFIRDIPANYDSITIVSGIIAMGKELKVNTLCEGVETQEQLDFLKSKGCDFVQGYYFSKPLAANHFTDLLIKSQEHGAAIPAALSKA